MDKGPGARGHRLLCFRYIVIVIVLKQLEIIYEDTSCIVINKPAGLAVQGGKGIGVSLDSILAKEWQHRPYLVHRLDRDTSGLILVARTKMAAAGFSDIFARQQGIIKRYRAVCKGKPEKQEGTIKLDLTVRGQVKKSTTRYKVQGSLLDGDYSLLELEPGTGRMHQIRRHLALTGNPILGDDKYGDFPLNRHLRKTMKLKHLLLHASGLIIRQTPIGLSLDLNAPLPAYFEQFITH